LEDNVGVADQSAVENDGFEEAAVAEENLEVNEYSAGTVEEEDLEEPIAPFADEEIKEASAEDSDYKTAEEYQQQGLSPQEDMSNGYDEAAVVEENTGAYEDVEETFEEDLAENPSPTVAALLPEIIAVETEYLEGGVMNASEVPIEYSLDQGAAELERINGIIAANQDLLSSLLELLRTQVRVCASLLTDTLPWALLVAFLIG